MRYSRISLMRFSNYYSLVLQAIRKEPLTVYGDGKQTRSFQYVSDLVWQLCISMYLSHEISLIQKWFNFLLEKLNLCSILGMKLKPQNKLTEAAK